MRPINNWENVKAASGFETLPAGGYICRIQMVREVPNRNGGGSHLEVNFDVAEGEHKGFFTRDWQAQTREDKFWRGRINQNIPQESSPKYATQCSFFRSFTDAIEDSNPGYHWDWDETGLKGKFCGVVFGERERVSQRGTTYVVTEADRIVSVDDIRKGNFKIPELKKADTRPAAPGPVDWTSFADDDLPL